jgi:hypothetical protein
MAPVVNSPTVLLSAAAAARVTAVHDSKQEFYLLLT